MWKKTVETKMVVIPQVAIARFQEWADFLKIEVSGPVADSENSVFGHVYRIKQVR